MILNYTRIITTMPCIGLEEIAFFLLKEEKDRLLVEYVYSPHKIVPQTFDKTEMDIELHQNTYIIYNF